MFYPLLHQQWHPCLVFLKTFLDLWWILMKNIFYLLKWTLGKWGQKITLWLLPIFEGLNVYLGYQWKACLINLIPCSLRRQPSSFFVVGGCSADDVGYRSSDLIMYNAGPALHYCSWGCRGPTQNQEGLRKEKNVGWLRDGGIRWVRVLFTGTLGALLEG